MSFIQHKSLLFSTQHDLQVLHFKTWRVILDLEFRDHHLKERKALHNQSELSYRADRVAVVFFVVLVFYDVG